MFYYHGTYHKQRDNKYVRAYPLNTSKDFSLLGFLFCSVSWLGNVLVEPVPKSWANIIYKIRMKLHEQWSKKLWLMTKGVDTTNIYSENCIIS